MGILGLISEAKMYIRKKQYERAVQHDIDIENRRLELKRLQKERVHLERAQRIEREKENIRKLKATPLKRMAGVLQKKEVQELKQESPFNLGGSKKESPFGLGNSKENPFVK